jgi:hypothetical protein
VTGLSIYCDIVRIVEGAWVARCQIGWQVDGVADSHRRTAVSEICALAKQSQSQFGTRLRGNS